MEEYNARFKETLHKFVKEVHKVTQSKNTEKILNVFHKLKMDKTQEKILTNLTPYADQIKNRDEQMFENKIILIPGINLHTVWNKLSDSQKNKCWLYLKILYILSEICTTNVSKMGDNILKTDTNVASETTTDNTETENTETENTNKESESESDTDEDTELKFNPYEGIGNNDVNYNVQDMFTGIEKLGKVDKPSLDSLVKTFGVDKFAELEKLQDQLKNMNEDDIESATQNIQSLMGDNVDKKTLNTLLTNVANELKNADMSQGNLFENLSNIAENVTKNMRTKIDNNEIDIKSLYKSTNDLAAKCSGGNSNLNPMNLIQTMIKAEQMKNTDSVDKNKDA